MSTAPEYLVLFGADSRNCLHSCRGMTSWWCVLASLWYLFCVMLREILRCISLDGISRYMNGFKTQWINKDMRRLKNINLWGCRLYESLQFQIQWSRLNVTGFICLDKSFIGLILPVHFGLENWIILHCNVLWWSVGIYTAANYSLNESNLTLLQNQVNYFVSIVRGHMHISTAQADPRCSKIPSFVKI